MDVHDTKLMTQVQYLAPLMAYFNPHLGDDSKVSTLDDGKLIFVWTFLNNNNVYTQLATPHWDFSGPM